MSWKHFWRANNKKNDWTWKKDERTKERRKKQNERFKQTHTERKVQTYKGEKTLQLFVCIRLVLRAKRQKQKFRLNKYGRIKEGI